MALACRPEILLCDEPTTALDVTIQAEILALLQDLRERSGLSMIFVSHDLAVVSAMADRLLVMRSGQLVETGGTATVMSAPEQDYTRNLLEAVLELPAVAPRLVQAVGASRQHRPSAPATAPSGPATVPLLTATGIVVGYGSGPSRVLAVHGVDLSVAAGRIHGLVGESGSGKTTLAKVLTGQLPKDAGLIRPGRAATAQTAAPGHQLSAIQMIYQDPYSSLDPRMTVRQTLSELLRLVQTAAAEPGRGQMHASC